MDEYLYAAFFAGYIRGGHLSAVAGLLGDKTNQRIKSPTALYSALEDSIQSQVGSTLQKLELMTGKKIREGQSPKGCTETLSACLTRQFTQPQLANLSWKKALRLEESLISSELIWEWRRNFSEDNPVCLRKSLRKKRKT